MNVGILLFLLLDSC